MMGLFLPLRTAATSDARRPNVYAEASTTYHFLSMVDWASHKSFHWFDLLGFHLSNHFLTWFLFYDSCGIPGLWYPAPSMNRQLQGALLAPQLLYYNTRFQACQWFFTIFQLSGACSSPIHNSFPPSRNTCFAVRSSIRSRSPGAHRWMIIFSIPRS